MRLCIDTNGIRAILSGIGSYLCPKNDSIVDLGLPDSRWNNVYTVSGSFASRPIVNGSGVALLEELSQFGKYAVDTSDDTISSTTLTSFQNKLLLTTTSLPSGRYRIGWSFEYSINAIARDMEIRIQLDGSDVLGQPRPRAGKDDVATDIFWPAAGFAYRNLSPGVHNVSLDFRRSSSQSATVSIRYTKLELWRVS